MIRLKIPAFIIHAQVLELWKPPTQGYEIKGLWWSDVFPMKEHFKSVKQRRDENRGAAYFSKKAVHPIATFADSHMDGNHFALVNRYKKEGIPKMYEVTQ